MPNYRAYIVQTRYRAFEFEADDEILAHDHIDKLVRDYYNNQEAFMDMADESGPDDFEVNDVEEI